MAGRWRAKIARMQGMAIYCERGADGFWAEPLNALSNLAFVLAALASWRAYRVLNAQAGGGRRWDLLLLVVLMMAVGVGSFSWHTVAAPWSAWADVIPTLLFMNLYLVSFLYRGAGLGTPAVLVLLLAFQWAMVLAGTRFPPGFLNGSAFYLPALVALWPVALYGSVRLGARAWPTMAAAVSFTASLALRGLDLTLCPIFAPGTHFLWHLLNGLVLYLLFVGLVRLIDAPRRVGKSMDRHVTAGP